MTAAIYKTFTDMLRRFILVIGLAILPITAHARFPFAYWTFAPRPNPTPNFWYDASILGLSNGATVSTWTEALGNTSKNGVLSGTGTAPTYTKFSQYGLSTILFQNSARYYEPSLSLAFPTTVAAVVNVRNTGSAGAILGAASNNGPAFFIYNTGPYNFGIAKIGTGNAGLSTSTFTGGAWHFIVFTISATAWALYVDGASAGSGSNALGAFGGAVQIGAVLSGSNNRFDGSIAEILCYNSVLSSTDLAALNTYSKIKWGTP